MWPFNISNITFNTSNITLFHKIQCPLLKDRVNLLPHGCGSEGGASGEWMMSFSHSGNIFSARERSLRPVPENDVHKTDVSQSFLFLQR